MNDPNLEPQFDLRSEQLIVEFEQARRLNLPIDIQAEIDWVPAEQRSRLVAEIACIDLEHAFEQGERVDVSPFLTLYPAVFQASEFRDEVAREHYRLYRLFGIEVPRSEVARRYSLGKVNWAELPIGEAKVDHVDPIRFPQVGSTFCGYPLIAELGRGSLARVFIARQPDLAERWVVLKITQRLTTEAEKLASLQHSGIIPVYSIHRDQELYCICMPYLGAITLGHLLADGRLFSRSCDSTVELVSTLVANRLSTIVSTLGVEANSESDLQTDEPKCNVSRRPVYANLGDGHKLPELLGLPELAESLQEQFLCRRSFMSVVSLMEQLTEAVGYAHSRGIVHRDLKPENILIANDGRPVVLDFNLAASGASPASLVGGTISYMSPQHLRALETGGSCSPQDDVFSIGVIFYQLLTGKTPFESYQKTVRDIETKDVKVKDFNALAAWRETPPPNCRAAGAKVPASLDAIVMKCLAPNVKERYSSANELHEDLFRFTSHRVLAHAKDRSPVERVQKFVRRNPLLTSMSSLITLSTLVVVGLIASLVFSQTRAAKYEATYKSHRLGDALPETLAMLRSPGGETDLISNGMRNANVILKEWGIEGNQPKLGVVFHRLTADEQKSVRQHLGELVYAMAGAQAQLAHSDSTTRDKLLAEARRLNQLAGEILPELEDAVRLRLQKMDGLSQLDLQIGAAPSLFSRMLMARESGDTTLWVELADELVSARPTDPSRWFTLAAARLSSGDLGRAQEAFDAAAKLQKNSAMAIFWRGVTRLRGGNPVGAQQDFSTCITMRSDWIAPRFNRALAKRASQELDGAIDDLNWIVSKGAAGPRVYSLRSQLHLDNGDRGRAAEDHKLALNATARDAEDWVALGVLKLRDQPAEALQDFALALEIAPRNVAALLNTAHVQAELLGETKAAVDTLSVMIAANLGGTTAIASRGILHARLGDAMSALADAELAAQGKPTAMEMLQIAGIHAMASKTDHERNLNALGWLTRALAADPKLSKLAAADPDLVSLRGLQQFQSLMASAD